MRISDWSSDVCSSDLPTIAINDTATPIERRDGYALLRRRCRAGDRITLTLPMTLAVEPTPDDPRVVAYTHAPHVLDADLGPANQHFHPLRPPPLAVDHSSAPTAVHTPGPHLCTPGAKHRTSDKQRDSNAELRP